MKIAFLAESPADQAALTILTEAILGCKAEAISHTGLRSRGWPMVRTVLPSVLKDLHYQSEAEGFVMIVDSNGALPHLPEHELPNPHEPKCRLCQLRQIADNTLSQIHPRAGLAPLKTAIGLAVPEIEAWLLCGVDPHVTEAAWTNGLKEGREPYSKEDLKQQLYGTSHPSLALETQKMTEAATRLSQNLSALEKLFPNGFGAMLKSLRSW
jgi:hypothetical protein